jgi:hypothetical protein
LLARAPGQRTYDLLRPVVLFGQLPIEYFWIVASMQRSPSVAFAYSDRS